MNKHVVICTFVFLTFLNPVHGAPTQIEISRYQTDLNCARPTTYLPVNFNFKQYMKTHSNKQIEAFIEFVANHTCQEITTEAEDIFYIVCKKAIFPIKRSFVHNQPERISSEENSE